MMDKREHTAGLLAALGCFSMWGVLPLYFHLIGPAVSPWEILTQRMVWAAVLLTLFVLITRRHERVMAVVRQRRLLLTLMASALLISCNWGVFIWAVSSHHVLQASLGYYINPLLNVVLGLIFFRERLRPLQIAAVLLAAAGVLIMVVGFGRVPWVSLILAGTFGVYGAIRKRIAVDSITGLYIETMLLLPFALLWLGSLYMQQQAVFLQGSVFTDALLVGCGLITILPLVLFTMGARRLKLGTLGLIQYLTPTLHLLTGVFVFGETFNQANLITFACIWAGLAIYTVDTLRAQRQVTQG
ncbi:chloramphenicol resistance permease RarD [Kushneria pakistanensis]|uniref:Chloramphenicol resistance permease RarD n=1 Tax=Kushneria pakistanensis TaxID=1508770 RepID=A0ABQ3FJF3_9GAMM|nr:EamA family transporter RarD [Kushneria pakistanensis]GHC25648.1 chloramphenicol resistance permease RarD [Kushneria pakistanensis]